MRYLENAHPAVCFLYLFSVIAITVFTRDPVMTALSLAGGALCAGFCGRLRGMLWLPVMAACAALANPLFAHSGATVLFFVGDTAFTAEALAYGAVFGGMLAAAVLWSAAGTRFMTSEKYVWLFGRAVPAAGLVLSCTLRFVPLFIRRTRDFASARGASGVKGYLSAFSDSVGCSAEQAMTSAEIMRSRGYGTGRRTFYSRHRFGLRDAAALAATALCAGGSAALMVGGAGEFGYYPLITGLDFSAADIALYIMFGALCFLPSAAVLAEELRRARAGV